MFQKLRFNAVINLDIRLIYHDFGHKALRKH